MQNYKVKHMMVGAFPQGHVFSESDLPIGYDIERFLALEAVEKTDEPRTGNMPLNPESIHIERELKRAEETMKAEMDSDKPKHGKHSGKPKPDTE